MTTTTLIAIALLAWTGEAERVMVSSAKVRAAIAYQPCLPDQPPVNIVLPHVPRPTPKPRGMSLELTGDPISSANEQRVHSVTLHVTTDCEPCRRMKAELHGDNRLNVTDSLNVIPPGVPATSFPFVTFRDASGTLRYNLTARTAEAVVRLLDRHGANRTASFRRVTANELKVIARIYRGPETGVSGMSVTAHLMDNRHGYSADQLAGLTHPELLALHSATHSGFASPFQPLPNMGAKPSSDVVGASGAAGTFHGREQITEALDWIRSNVGEGVPMTFSWHRSGLQNFPLLAKADWSALAIFGRSGRIEIDAPNSQLPVDHVGFGYRIAGDDLVIDADGITIKGAASLLSPRESSEMSGAMGLDPMTIWSVLSVMRMVWSVLNPSADLTLGGNVSAEAVLNGDMLTVTFKQMPSIRLVSIFTFQLGVQRVEISPTKVRLVFSGSRWVKERTFEVK